MQKIKWILLILSIPFSATAWGPIGHQTIGLIAESQLTPQARSQIKQLLVTESLGDVANWADSIRSGTTYRQSIWYHFEKIPDQVLYLENLNQIPDWQKKKGGLITAILFAVETLRNAQANLNDQTIALKFLVHFLGDLHQPLHSGRPEDNGGVKINTDWGGFPSNLHQIWDSGMIYTGHQDLFKNLNDPGQKSLAYANDLLKRFSNQNIETEFLIENWLNESLALRTAAYLPLYKTNQEAYLKAHLSEVDLRVYSAGIRLGALLNQIYVLQSPLQNELDLIQSIEAILGKIENLISFRP